MSMMNELKGQLTNKSGQNCLSTLTSTLNTRNSFSNLKNFSDTSASF